MTGGQLPIRLARLPGQRAEGTRGAHPLPQPKTVPTWRVDNVDEAKPMPDHRSREAGRRESEPGSATVSLQRRERLLARARETAADIKARP